MERGAIANLAALPRALTGTHNSNQQQPNKTPTAKKRGIRREGNPDGAEKRSRSGDARGEGKGGGGAKRKENRSSVRSTTSALQGQPRCLSTHPHPRTNTRQNTCPHTHTENYARADLASTEGRRLRKESGEGVGGWVGGGEKPRGQNQKRCGGSSSTSDRGRGKGGRRVRGSRSNGRKRKGRGREDAALVQSRRVAKHCARLHSPTHTHTPQNHDSSSSLRRVRFVSKQLSSCASLFAAPFFPAGRTARWWKGGGKLGRVLGGDG